MGRRVECVGMSRDGGGLWRNVRGRVCMDRARFCGGWCGETVRRPGRWGGIVGCLYVGSDETVVREMAHVGTEASEWSSGGGFGRYRFRGEFGHIVKLSSRKIRFDDETAEL